MSLLKYIERLKRIDDLIRRKATGNPEEFAKKLNISRSQLLQDLKELKELGAAIEYSFNSRSYYYGEECKIILDFRSRKIYGGLGIVKSAIDHISYLHGSI